MRWAWLEIDVPRVVAWALMFFVGYLVLVQPLYRRWRWPRLPGSAHGRLERLSRWQTAGDLALCGVLLLIPGITATSLGLAVPAGRSWVPAIGITGGTIAVAVVLALRRWVAYTDNGCFVERDEAARRRDVRDVVLGGLGDTFVFIVLPPAVAVGALGFPLGHVAVAMVVGYGFVHVPNGIRHVLGWTVVATVAVACYLMTASALLPAVLLTSVAVTRIYGVPMLPEEPPGRPPLTLVEPPSAG